MRAASGRAIGERSDAVLRTAMAVPGAIAQSKRRVDMPNSLVVGRPRLADIG